MMAHVHLPRSVTVTLKPSIQEYLHHQQPSYNIHYDKQKRKPCNVLILHMEALLECSYTEMKVTMANKKIMPFAYFRCQFLNVRYHLNQT